MSEAGAGERHGVLGLARATEGDRAKDFVREAVKRKDSVSEREKMYVEAEEDREAFHSRRILVEI